ncbi:MAG TPA: hypothetical protein VII06_26745 [Chloroflexota bacterium]
MAATVAGERAGAVSRTQPAARLLPLLVALLLLLLGGLYFAARRPTLPFDDPAEYVVSAVSLAQGQGYRVPAYPADPPNTFVPPGYSLLLAALFKLQPGFPANLALMELVSLVGFYALLALSAVILRRRFGASPAEITLALLLVATTPLAISLSTAIMSDTLFAVLALGSVLLVGTSWERPGRAGLLLLLAGGLLAAGAYYTRLAGIAVVAAVGLDALRRARHAAWWRVALGLLPAALLVPWIAWVSLNGGSGYTRHWASSIPGSAPGMEGPRTFLLGLIGNAVQGDGVLYTVAPPLSDVWPLSAAIFVYVVWQSWRGWWRDGEVTHLYLLFYLLVLLPVAVLVSGRYVWPVAPLLAWHVVSGLRRGWGLVSARLGRPRLRADWLVVGTLLLTNVVGLGVTATRVVTSGWTVDEYYRDELAALLQTADYLRTLDPPTAAIGTNNWSTLPWWYLYTGRRGIDAVARTDGADGWWVPRARQGDPEAISYFIYHRDNGRPGDDTDDRSAVEAALRARGASTTPLYCTADRSVCIYDWRRRAPAP